MEQNKQHESGHQRSISDSEDFSDLINPTKKKLMQKIIINQKWYIEIRFPVYKEETHFFQIQEH